MATGGVDIPARGEEEAAGLTDMTALREWIRQQFAAAGNDNVSDDRVDRIANEIASGERTREDVKNDIFKAEGTAQNDRGVDESDENDLAIMGGPHEWYVDKSGNFFIAYKAPAGHWVYFEASEQEMNAIFGSGIRPPAEEIGTEKELASRRRFHFGGTVTEVTGDGNFLTEMEGAITRSAGDLDDWARDSEEIMTLAYLAQEEQWSPDKMWNEIAKTRDFKRHFKGIDNFTSQGLNTVDAVRAWKQYQSGLNNLYKRMGMERTATGAQIEKLTDQGHSIDDVEFVYEHFDRMQKNQGAFKAFNNILRAKGLDTMRKADQMKFLMGQAPKELYDIWEQSSVLEAARRESIGKFVSANEAIRLAERTAGIQTQEGIDNAMRQAAALALRYRAEVDTQKYGISADDLIDMSFGLRPRSGKSGAELQLIMDKISREAEGFLRQQATPYIGFTESGQPGARSLGESRQEGL